MNPLASQYNHHSTTNTQTTTPTPNNIIAIDFTRKSNLQNTNTSSTDISTPPSLYTSDGRIKPSAADPVKNKETIQEIKDYLYSTGRYGHRNYLIYTVGINIGRRAGDLLKLRISDVTSSLYPLIIKTEVTHIEQKTGKKIEFYFNDTVKKAIWEYLTTQKKLDPNMPLFVSQKKSKFNPETMIIEEDRYRLSAKSYWGILKQVKDDLELNINFGTHTMRKTFGYHKYQEYKNTNIEGGINIVDMLQDTFGHHTGKQSLTYIGITKENKQMLYCDSSL